MIINNKINWLALSYYSNKCSVILTFYHIIKYLYIKIRVYDFHLGVT